jgi:Domain of unknown function (DUF4157)
MSRRARAKGRGNARQSTPRPAPARRRAGVWQAGNNAVSRALGDLQASFGEDFSGVKVDSSAQARQTAQALGATAVTQGETILLGPDAPAPETSAGRRLLAHELAHVVQQRRASVVEPGVVGTAGGSFEAGADRAASQAMLGQAAHVPAGGAAPGVQRQQSPAAQPVDFQQMMQEYREKLFGPAQPQTDSSQGPDKAPKKSAGLLDRFWDWLTSGKKEKGPKMGKVETPSTTGQRDLWKEGDANTKTQIVKSPGLSIPQPGEKKKQPAIKETPALDPTTAAANDKAQSDALEKAVSVAMSYARVAGKDTAEVALDEILGANSDTVLPEVQRLAEAAAPSAPNVKTVKVRFGSGRPTTFQVGAKK